MVDDHLLLRILPDDEPTSLRPASAAVATTGLWYHRLCRALAGGGVVGSMSRRLGNVDPAVAADVVASVLNLPESIELVSLRSLGWPMGELVHAGARLNLPSLEALASARHLDAEICLAEADGNVPLQLAAQEVGVPVRTIKE